MISTKFVGLWPFTAKWVGVCSYGGATFETIQKYNTHDAAEWAAQDMARFIKNRLDVFAVESVDMVLNDYGYRRGE